MIKSKRHLTSDRPLRFKIENIKTSLKTSSHMNNKNVNNNYKIKETPNASEVSSFENRKIETSLKGSILMNNNYKIKETPNVSDALFV